MKTSVLSTIIVMSVAAIVALCIACSHKPSETGKTPNTAKTATAVTPADDAVLTFFEYRRSAMTWPPEHYRLTPATGQQGKYRLLCSSPYTGVCDIVQVDDSVARQVSQLVMRYKLLDIDNSYEISSEYQVLDGYAWNLTIRYNDGTKKLSNGHNAAPDTEGFHEIGKYLGTVAKNAGGEWKIYNDIEP